MRTAQYHAQIAQLGAVAFALVLVTVIPALFCTGPQSDRIGEINDCVIDLWTEWEDRHGEIPPVELERQWHRDCADKASSK